MPGLAVIGAELPAYGKALGCIPRPFFAVTVAAIFFLVSAEEIGVWLLRHSIYNDRHPPSIHPCTGIGCYEVFSCYGMQKTTWDAREPLDTIGAFFCGLAGIVGAWNSNHRALLLFAYYLIFFTVLQVISIIADLAYIDICGAFPYDVIEEGLGYMYRVLYIVNQAVWVQVMDMTVYPSKAIYDLTDQAHVVLWYLFFALIRLVVYAVCAWEIWYFAQVMQRGLLGLGVNYRLDPWGEKVRENFHTDVAYLDIKEKWTSAGHVDYNHEYWDLEDHGDKLKKTVGFTEAGQVETEDTQFMEFEAVRQRIVNATAISEHELEAHAALGLDAAEMLAGSNDGQPQDATSRSWGDARQEQAGMQYGTMPP